MAIHLSPGAEYGWRARIGFLQPSQVTDVNSFEFYLMAPPGVMLCLTSMGVTSLTQEMYDRAIANVESAIDRLVHRDVDVIVQAGVPPIVTHGWGYEDVVREKVAGFTSLPFVTDIGACVQGMQTLGLSRVILVTAFEPEMNQTLTEYVRGAGIEVVASTALPRPASPDINSMPLAVPYRAARDLFARNKGVDGVWFTGAFMPTVGAIQSLEDDLGVPVVSSMQSMVWSACRTLHIHDQVPDFGQLWRH